MAALKVTFSAAQRAEVGRRVRGGLDAVDLPGLDPASAQAGLVSAAPVLLAQQHVHAALGPRAAAAQRHVVCLMTGRPGLKDTRVPLFLFSLPSFLLGLDGLGPSLGGLSPSLDLLSPSLDLLSPSLLGLSTSPDTLRPSLGDCVFCWLAFRFLDAAHLAGLDALFPPGAHGGALDPGAAHRHRDTLVPGADLPVVQVFVPVAHSEAALLVVGPLCLVAVGVQGGPAFSVGAPYRPALAAAGATLTAHATAPRTWKKTKEKSRKGPRTSSRPRTHLIQTSSRPHPHLIQTSSRPCTHLIKTQSRPRPDLIQTSSRPSPDLIQTSSRPSPDLMKN
ncbi:hypothetical protein EYF80_056486 [Liparis tanakae]|uniref:Uncharacterized protein n=1 Tax=Liparis tanakae TaxID=230148 RepID=A0A4Z2EYR0_9TELE|nr:hypothetical protein EYF80_056486 [Liparis tanakae]